MEKLIMIGGSRITDIASFYAEINRAFIAVAARWSLGPFHFYTHR